jgi:hypothetical protein
VDRFFVRNGECREQSADDARRGLGAGHRQRDPGTGLRSLGVRGGSANCFSGIFFSASSIKARQIGATIRPEISFMERLSLFPAQVPTARFGVYPIIHASRLSFVVPVFAATSRPGM